jgi:hypothetical protein
MLRRVEGVVEQVTAERAGAQEVRVRPRNTDGQPASANDEQSHLRAAINLLALNPPVRCGERVLLNTTAVELGLGTGGLDFVICSLDRTELSEPSPGHIMKLRYTPHQLPVLAVEAPESAYHEGLRQFESLDECPVVCAELHSQLPAICYGAHWGLKSEGWSRDPHVVYIMTDGASLPLALSRLAPRLKALGLVQTIITCGQAFGGDYEAVNLYSALAAARTVCAADLIVVAQGPGAVGADTPLGFSGVEQGTAINAAGSLGGIPILAPRIGFGDSRKRHHGISHHTLTVLQRVALAPALIPLPRLPESEFAAIKAALDAIGAEELHQTVVVAADPAFAEFRTLDIGATTMGRTVDQEPAFFLAGIAAGLLAAQVVAARQDSDVA